MLLHHGIEHITLMHLNGNQCFDFGASESIQVLGGHVDEVAQNFRISAIGELHDALLSLQSIRFSREPTWHRVQSAT